MEELHNARIEFGKHRGELWTRLPIPYLKFLANTGHGSAQAIALAELDRRNINFEKSGDSIEITIHAIDRASKKLLGKWKREANDDEGIGSWLARTALDALEKGDYKNGRYEWQGVRYVISKGYIEPTLISIYPIIKKERVCLSKTQKKQKPTHTEMAVENLDITI